MKPPTWNADCAELVGVVAGQTLAYVVETDGMCNVVVTETAVLGRGTVGSDQLG